MPSSPSWVCVSKLKTGWCAGRTTLLSHFRSGHFPARMRACYALAVEKAAAILGVKVVVAIRDEGANLVLLHAMDDSYIASVQASQDKAYTAVALKMPTHIALDESRGGSLDGLTNGNGILLLGGGYPLRTDKKIYGGIGVSGGTKEQDTTLAMVADAYFKARFA